MRRGYLFWGSVLILLSLLFLLKAIGVVEEIFSFFWPLAIMLLGAWILISALLPRPKFTFAEDETFNIDLQGATQANLEIHHGAGQLEIFAGAPKEKLVIGSSGVGMEYSSRLDGQTIKAKINAGPSFLPFLGPSSGTWQLKLNKDVPITLDLDAGASRLVLDMSDLQLPYARLKTGASSMKLTLPKHSGNTLLDIEAGAASVEIQVPKAVVARIRIKQGVSALDIDSQRFPRLESGIYQSPDYDKAVNRVELNIEAGVGSLKIY